MQTYASAMTFYESLQTKLQRLIFSRAEQQAFLEDISLLIEDGVPLRQAVDIIREFASGSSQQVAKNVLIKLAEGKNFADGLQTWFPQPIVEIIRAGEEGGTLPQTLSAAAHALAQNAHAITSLISSILYPLAVIILGLIVSVFIRRSIFVSFSQIKPVATWPTNSQILYYLATFLQSWWWLVIIIVILLALGFSQLFRSLTGKSRELIDTIPVLSLYRRINAARFMETLGLLLANGVILKKALSILQQGATPYMGWHLFMMQFRLSGGRENIAEVVDTGLINKADISRLRVIAKGKGFEHALLRLGQQSAARNAKAIQFTGKIFGGILLALGAAFAAFMIFAIYNVGSFVGTQ